MAIILEDGTGVVDANSYVSLAEARTFLQGHGFSLPSDDTVAEATLVRAASYLSSFDEDLLGIRSSALQPMLWPRSGDLSLSSTESIPGDSIPKALKDAQCFAAKAEADSELLSSSSSDEEGRAITKEKIGPIETTYQVQNSGTPSAHDPKKVGSVELALRPLKRRKALSSGIPTSVCRA